ncbi:MAG: GTP-binding protein [archaeon]|nr:GTP-binding protein [archaeon]
MEQMKAVVCGNAGVGKSTIVSLLQGKERIKRNPTVGVNVEQIFLGDHKIAVWDFAGQKRFQFLWDDFLTGSSLTLLVTDSTKKNVEETKEIMERLGRKLGSKIISIANMQDLKDRMSPQEISNFLGVPTIGMVAINKAHRTALMDILSGQIK